MIRRTEVLSFLIVFNVFISVKDTILINKKYEPRMQKQYAYLTAEQKPEAPSYWNSFKQLLTYPNLPVYKGEVVYNFDDKDLNKGAIIDYLGVDEKFRNQGVGAALFKAALDDLKAKGFRKAYWDATDSSVPFYKKVGGISRNKELPYYSNPMKIYLRQPTFMEKVNKYAKKYTPTFERSNPFE